MKSLDSCSEGLESKNMLILYSTNTTALAMKFELLVSEL